jgi:hypothetical protein
MGKVKVTSEININLEEEKNCVFLNFVKGENVTKTPNAFYF